MVQIVEKKGVYSKESYLELEEKANFKSEFHNGEILAMSGGSVNHSLIATNVTGEFYQLLRGKECRVFNSDLKIHIPKKNSFVYPDVSLICGPIEYAENRKDAINNPHLIVEVLSPSTESYDRTTKFQYYYSIPSLKEYILISQEKHWVEVFYKQAPQSWLYHVYSSLEENIKIHTIHTSVKMASIYQNVELENNPNENLPSTL